MDWVHCNNCYRLPGQGIQFFLTNCGHIYCVDCKPICTTNVCKLCSNPCNTIPLSAQMKPEVEQYFTDPLTLLKKNLAKIEEVAEFQNNHRARLMTHQNSMIQRAKDYKEEYKKLINRFKECDQQRQKLKKEVERFKRMQYSQINSPISQNENYQYVTPTSQTVPESANNSGFSVLKTGFQKNVSYLKSLFSPTDSTPGLTSGVNRMSVTSPPRNGRMGTISGNAVNFKSPGYENMSSQSSTHESPTYYTPELNLSGVNQGKFNSGQNCFKPPTRRTMDKRKATIYPYSPCTD